MLNEQMLAGPGAFVQIGSSAVEANIVPIVLFGVLGAVGFVAVMFWGIGWILTNRQRERTKREIAAYVAEGSMTSEEGERLMKAAADQAGD